MLRFNRFRIEITPSPETNSHEVRLFGDEQDLIALFPDRLIGMDPDDILGASSPLRASSESHTATVARCACGEVGCGSAEVRIVRDGESIIWAYNDDLGFVFDARAYDHELARAIVDASWETPDRTAARLFAASPLPDRLAQLGFRFEWASGRARQDTFTVSLRLRAEGTYQVLVNEPWGQESPEEIVARMRETIEQAPQSWSNVEWFPQSPPIRHAPAIAGPGWRRGPTP